MIEQIFDQFSLEGVTGFPHKIKVTNNFIGSISGSYSSQSVETKRITITPSDYDAWVGIVYFLMGEAFGLTSPEAKVLVGLCELSNTEREFSNIAKVHEYISARIGICPLCVRNQVYELRKKGLVKKKKTAIYQINETVWWMLRKKDTSRRLLISVDYEPELNVI